MDRVRMTQGANPMPVLTVREALGRPLFRRCELLAGQGGLDREIAWVHIAEVPHVGQVIRGRELVLTTAIGLADEAMLVSFVRQLVQRDASCLVVELVQSFRALPPAVLELANRHDLPIVGSAERLKFVDVTQDLHRLILSREMESVNLAQQVRERMLDLGSVGASPVEILRVLAEFSGGVAEYVGHEETIRYPEGGRTTTAHRGQQLSRNVMMLGVPWGRLRLTYPNSALAPQMDRLMGAAAASLGQGLAFSMVSRPYGALGSDLVLQTALRGESSPVTRQWLWRQLELAATDRATVLCVEPRSEGASAATSEALRRVLGQLRRRGIVCSLGDTAAALLAWPEDGGTLLGEVGARLRDQRLDVWLGAGDPVAMSGALDTCYRQAAEVVRLSGRLGRQMGPAHADLALYRLLPSLNPSLTARVEETLGALLVHDREHHEDLVGTLRTYFDTLGNKCESAERLHLHRQTMYYRLRKIQSLLGRGYLDPPERRLALDLAVHLAQLLPGAAAESVELRPPG
jgi:purine catabolism regulator